MNLQQLYYFKTIAELEHYTKASEKLSISQSSLSHAIQSMEEELNVKLFARRGRNVVLTKYGKMLLPYVTQSLGTLEDGLARLEEEINPDTGSATIACFPSLAEFLPDIIVRYVSETNRTNVHLQTNQESTYYTLREQLLAGKVDMVFATKIDDPKIGCTLIGEHDVVLLVPKGHRLAACDAVDLRELDGEDYIAYSKDSQLREQADRYFEGIGIKPNITMETAQDIIIFGLVAANHGVAIVPYPLGGIPYNTKIVRLKGTDRPKRNLYLMWNKEEYLPPAAQRFRDFVVKSGLVFNEYRARKNIV